MMNWIGQNLWILTTIILVPQAFVVFYSTLKIRHRRNTKPQDISEREEDRKRFLINIWSFLQKPIWINIMVPLVLIGNVILWIICNLVPAVKPTLSISAEHVLFLNVFAIMLAGYTHVAFWQLESEILYYFNKIDFQWSKIGNIHKIYIIHALKSIDQISNFISSKLFIEGDEHIYDTPSDDKEALDCKEKYIKDISLVQQEISKDSLMLDKDPSCCERIAEDLFLLIAKNTMKPLADSVVRIQKNHNQNILFFPTAYATLVWQSSLALAKKLNTKPMATSTISFKEFYNHYNDATYSHPNFTETSTARRLFIVDENHNWSDELKKQLIILEEEDERVINDLPISIDGNSRISYFEWIKQAHDKIGWEFRFINRSEAEITRVKSKHEGELPSYMDFLIIPAANEWKVIFSCELNERKPVNAYGLPLECCPLTIRYTKAHSFDQFFEHLWEDAKPAHNWLTTGITEKSILDLSTYKSLLEKVRI